jgi:3-oxoacyl-[acyl-carrier-protein] synthase II
VVNAQVTGLGWATPLGTDLDGVWKALLDGADGTSEQPFPHRLRSQLVAMLPSSDADPQDRMVALAADTLTAAFADAGLAPHDPAIRLVLGTSYGADLDDPDTVSLHQWARTVADRIGHPHVPITVTTACSAGADSMLIGAELIAAGRCEVAVCGGVDVITAAKRLGHSALGTMSTSGLRAFDEQHDGMVLGEGAGFVVLEAAERARARSARVYATLSGAGSANDATGMTAPDSSGTSVVLATRRSLLHSGLMVEDIAVVSAHGSGTPLNDSAEAAALAELFADPGPLVFATKGALGHSLGATGAIEAITVILALRDGLVPPILGLRTPMAPLTLPVGKAREFTGTAGMSLTLGFGGFTTCLLFTRGPGL